MKFVWPDNGLCDISYLRKGRWCMICGTKRRFLVNVGYKKWKCLTCGIMKGNTHDYN